MLPILPELLLCVLESGYYTPKGKPNYRYLKACALVCRAWSGPAQTLLFRSVTQLRNQNILTFQAALLSSAAQGRPLGNCVRTLDILTEAYGDKYFGLQIVAELLQACPQLCELALGIFGMRLEEETLEKLRGTGQRLKAFNLVYFGGELPILYNLLGIWPTIQFLKIGCWTGSTPLPWDIAASPMLQGNANDTGEPAWRNGAEICLHDLALVMTPAPEVLTWLLASSADSLRILDLREAPRLTGRNILARHAPQLRSLRIASYNNDTVALLRMCTALKELVLYELELPPRCPLAPNLPPTIEHLCFTIHHPTNPITRQPLIPSHRTALQPLIDAVDVLPNLKVLTCGKGMRRLPCEVLERRCKMKGVEMVRSLAPNWMVGVEFYSNARAVC
ncbi:hypothetical protein M405DRAFT_211962 [Rhizopogon salebrosus TDB-379]|nr:hypothetical protein M405DRAFT_211962 [Rhizopogon salebrosus TDB-379]